MNRTPLYLRDGRFSKATAAGREIAGLHSEGQPLKLSVSVNGRREQYSALRELLLNGRTRPANSC